MQALTFEEINAVGGADLSAEDMEVAGGALLGVAGLFGATLIPGAVLAAAGIALIATGMLYNK